MDLTSNDGAVGGLVMRWVEVPDARGGSRLESRWVDVTELHAAAVPAVPAA